MPRHPDVPRPSLAGGRPAGWRRVTRLAAVGLTGVLAFGGLAACSTDEAEVVPRTHAGDTAAVAASDPVAATVAASPLAYEAADRAEERRVGAGRRCWM